MVWDRLYHLNADFPALEVPEGLILARGTADPLADARRQQEIGTHRFGRPTGDWDLIHGELVTLTDPQRDTHRPTGRLPARGHSMYQRVMMVAARGSIAWAVWTYTMYAPQNGHRITNDNQAVFWKSRH
jgi:hypothetical protein